MLSSVRTQWPTTAELLLRAELSVVMTQESPVLASNAPDPSRTRLNRPDTGPRKQDFRLSEQQRVVEGLPKYARVQHPEMSPDCL